MEELYETYNLYEPSTRCWLDGNYFNKVFDEYDGLVSEPIIIEIRSTNDSQLISGPKLDLTQNPELIIRIIIEISIKSDPGEPLGSGISSYKHSNALLINSNRKEVYHFEPMPKHQYQSVIIEHLSEYIKKNLPQYKLVELAYHPEHYDRRCKDKGMCVAYVIKAALMYALDLEIYFSKDLDDIKRFASAIEYLF